MTSTVTANRETSMKTSNESYKQLQVKRDHDEGESLSRVFTLLVLSLPLQCLSCHAHFFLSSLEKHHRIRRLDCPQRSTQLCHHPCVHCSWVLCSFLVKQISSSLS